MIHAYAAARAGAPLAPFQFAAQDLAPNEIEVAVSHCGVCHSDLHLIDNDWDVSSYPLVPGHEIIGVISRLGAGVNQLNIGQRVGIGWLAGSCMKCDLCLSGRENLCRHNQPTCIGRHGGFASHVRTDARFAAAIPDELSSDLAAPLLCAGVTVFAPLHRQKLPHHARVGIVGLGGLGHLAVQFAAAFGFGVTVFSTAADKQADARGFGADQFVDVAHTSALAAAAGSCDFVLSTVPVDLPWGDYLNLLKSDGQLCLVGASPGEVRVPASALIDGQKSISGSAVGSNGEIAAMLRFAAEHKIAPQIERFPLQRANDALDGVRKNRLRYRAVLEISGRGDYP
jgi:alcohol/geraniol dehydrogenase (NADP+)